MWVRVNPRSLSQEVDGTFPGTAFVGIERVVQMWTAKNLAQHSGLSHLDWVGADMENADLVANTFDSA